MIGLYIVTVVVLIIWLKSTNDRIDAVKSENKKLKEALNTLIRKVNSFSGNHKKVRDMEMFRDRVVVENISVEKESPEQAPIEQELNGANKIDNKPDLVKSEQEVSVSLLESSPESSSEGKELPEYGLWKWFLHDWPLKIGALFVIFGVMYFLTYAIMNQWISPAWRIIIGSLIGIAGVFWGAHRPLTQKLNGSIIIGLGLAIYLLSLSAGRYFYDMLDSTVMMLLMSIMVGVVGWISVKKDYEGLAIVAMVCGAFVPLLVAPLLFDPTNILAYFSLLAVVACVVSYIKDRYRLYGATVGVYSIIVFGLLLYGALTGSIMQIDQYIAFGIAALFAMINLMSIMKSDSVNVLGFIGSCVNIGLLLLWILVLFPGSMDAVYIFICAGICFLMAAYLYHHDYTKNAIIAYGAFAVLFLTIGLSITLEGVILTYSYLALWGLLIVGIMYNTKSKKYNTYLERTFALPLLSFADRALSMLTSATGGFMMELVLLSIMLCIVVGSYIFMSKKIEKKPVGLFWWIIFVLGLLLVCRGIGGERYFGIVSTIVVIGLYMAVSHIPMGSGDQKQYIAKEYLVPGLLIPLAYTVKYFDTGPVYSLTLLLLIAGLLFIVMSEHDRSIEDAMMVFYVVAMHILIALLLHLNVDQSLHVLLGFITTCLLFIGISHYKKQLYWPVLLGATYWIFHAVQSVILSLQWDSGVIHEAGASLLAIIAGLYALYVYVAKTPHHNKQYLQIIAWTGYVFVFVSVWLFTHGLFDNQLSTLLSLGIYSIIGIWQYITGRNTGNKPATILGGVILAGVTLRIVLIELQGLDIIWKIITLLVVGAIFIASGFIKPKDG